LGDGWATGGGRRGKREGGRSGRGRGGSLGLGEELNDARVVVHHGSIEGRESLVVPQQGVGSVLQEAFHTELLAHRRGEVERGLSVLVRGVRVAPLLQEVREHGISLLPHHPVEQRIALVVLHVQKGTIL